jgi:ABC-type molybdate transport system substrate-binding protein
MEGEMEKQEQNSLVDKLTQINILAHKMVETYKDYEEARDEYLRALNNLETD